MFWPILASFSGCKPFLVALFCGTSKPDSLTHYLSDFIAELRVLVERGVVVDNRVYHIHIFTFICDAPARAWLKGIVLHTGYHSCDRCTVLGDRRHGRVVFCDREDDVVSDFP